MFLHLSSDPSHQIPLKERVILFCILFPSTPLLLPILFIHSIFLLVFSLLSSSFVILSSPFDFLLLPSPFSFLHILLHFLLLNSIPFSSFISSFSVILLLVLLFLLYILFSLLHIVLFLVLSALTSKIWVLSLKGLICLHSFIYYFIYFLPDFFLRRLRQ